jgi:hypothetical protein
MGRIIRYPDVGSRTVPVNVFQPPSSKDHIPSLNLSCLTETIQVIQTTEIACIDLVMSIFTNFIPYMNTLLTECGLR